MLTSCADCVIVLWAGANAAASMADGSKGQIPVFQNALCIVATIKAFSQAIE
jgi:hypothetical protein